MRLLTLTQLNVRNLRTARLDFPPGIVAVVGQNAAGKSNLLEAVYLACTGELAGARTTEMVRLGEEEGYVAGEIEHDEGVSKVEVGLAPGRKQIRLDGQAARATSRRCCSPPRTPTWCTARPAGAGRSSTGSSFACRRATGR